MRKENVCTEIVHSAPVRYLILCLFYIILYIPFYDQIEYNVIEINPTLKATPFKMISGGKP